MSEVSGEKGVKTRSSRLHGVRRKRNAEEEEEEVPVTKKKTTKGPKGKKSKNETVTAPEPADEPAPVEKRKKKKSTVATRKRATENVEEEPAVMPEPVVPEPTSQRKRRVKAKRLAEDDEARTPPFSPDKKKKVLTRTQTKGGNIDDDYIRAVALISTVKKSVKKLTAKERASIGTGTGERLRKRLELMDHQSPHAAPQSQEEMDQDSLSDVDLPSIGSESANGTPRREVGRRPVASLA